MKNFEVYSLVKDNEILTDTHLFLFEHRLSAVFTLYLFSLTYACKDIKLYKVANYNVGSGLIAVHREFVCDYHDGLDVAKELLLDPIYEGSPITLDYLKGLMSDVDYAITKKYSGGNDDEIFGIIEKKSEESNTISD